MNIGYLTRTNMEYIEELFQSYLEDPASVSLDWQRFFEGVTFGQSMAGLSKSEIDVYDLIQTYREYGYFRAKLDPLGLREFKTSFLDLNRFGLDQVDPKKKFEIGKILGLQGATLPDILERLESIYCGSLSVQIADTDPKVRQWFIDKFEGEPRKLSAEERREIYHQVVRTESLEKFLHSRFVGAKRFSVEGGDSLIPMLETLTRKGTELSVEEVVIGMAHRGRINVLANFMGKALKVILAEFDGHNTIDERDFDGDVKYHLGYSSDKTTPHGSCHISLAFNPSHLEAVGPVVTGMTRAKQRIRKDTVERKKVVPVLIHGDAAFAGQGVVQETIQMATLQGYTVGGTIHIIVDNQVGFTATPEDARSTPFSSDFAKSQRTPVLHVNGDDVEACVRAMELAIEYRQAFGSDVIINMVCYRRFGHNEGDEPAFTQPKMYEVIRKHPTLREIYGRKLVADGVMTEEYYAKHYQDHLDSLQEILEQVRKQPPVIKPLAFGGLWSGYRRPTREGFEKKWPTQVKASQLEKVSRTLTTLPKEFNLHPKLKRLIEARSKMVTEDQIDWGMGELLAYGTLLEDGYSVRVSGQDCVRGTFSHRHSAFYDTDTGQPYFPLKKLEKNDNEFCVYNSHLSEMGVLGFEYGNSSSDPTFLTVWEAQFGDFANGAQIIIDQFIASGEQKWLRMSGVVLLLPHGYEGQGPEHSSARLERFLQLCGQDNIQVCNLTTPAQIFHALRRQMIRDFRVPLVIMSPKSLLRHPKVVSKAEEFTSGRFQEVIPDPAVKSDQVKTAVLVSGKLYYELLERREKLGKKFENVALVRMEQLYPYPDKLILKEIKSWPHLERVIWAQEEPMNMGGWAFMRPWLEQSMQESGQEGLDLHYVGRKRRASPATGSPGRHNEEQAEILEHVFKLAEQ